MKYSKVEIRKVNRLSKSKNKYEVTFKDLEYDRYDENPPPNPLGFYYYRSRIGNVQITLHFSGFSAQVLKIYAILHSSKQN